MNRIRMVAVGALCVSAACVSAAEVSLVETRGDVNAAVARVAAAGGGRVVIPKGDWPTPSVRLASNVELHLAEGARLSASTNRADYASLNLPYCEGDLMAVVTAVGATNVAITGRGEIFGNGTAWPQPGDYGGNQEGTRPRGIVFANCRDVRLSDFVLRDSPCWGIVIKNCDGVVARRVKVDSHANANNDGFDVEARNVLIEDCDVDSGDDAFCLKSNDPGFVMENVTIRRCVGRSNCNAFKIGTASHGTVRNVRFEDCRTEAPRRDFIARIGPHRGEPWFRHNQLRNWPGGPEKLAGMAGIAIECVDGGEVSGITCRGFDIQGMMVPVFVRGGTRTGRSCGTPPSDRRILRDILIADVKAVAESFVASSVTGVAGCRPCGVRLENVTLVCKPGKAPPAANPVPERAGNYPEGNTFGMLPVRGLYIRHADDVVLKDVKLTCADADAGDLLHCEDAGGFRRLRSGDAARAVTVPCARTNEAGQVFRYRFHAPAKVEAGRRYPLVLFLHGAGERGDDNAAQLKWGVDELTGWFAARDEEFYLVAGQVPRGKRWVEVDWGLPEHRMPTKPSESMSALIALVEDLFRNASVDRSRVYVTGISMGGYGTWDLLCRKPEWFAAGLPICGGGDPHQAWRIRTIPIWAFHGSADRAVPVCRSRKMTAALWQCDGSVMYREYPDAPHNVWSRTYADGAVLDWFFSHGK